MTRPRLLLIAAAILLLAFTIVAAITIRGLQDRADRLGQQLAAERATVSELTVTLKRCRSALLTQTMTTERVRSAASDGFTAITDWLDSDAYPFGLGNLQSDMDTAKQEADDANTLEASIPTAPCNRKDTSHDRP